MRKGRPPTRTAFFFFRSFVAGAGILWLVAPTSDLIQLILFDFAAQRIAVHT
jgi:hypothetical protein